jgi:hypothetical protein
LEEWPALPYEDWRDTLGTLHMYTQVIGKLRLALSPFEAEWANVALYVTSRGLTTSSLPYGQRSLDAEFDFVDHAVVIRSSDGGSAGIALGGQAVSDFYREISDALNALGMPVAINEHPQEVPDPIPFSEDRSHHSYDPISAHTFWQVLTRVDTVMKQHRARFWGKTSPVHFFWGSFDLANVRFSGRRAAPPDGAEVIMRYAEDAEQICSGFWAGDERTPFPAFYAYGYPKPNGCEEAVCQPAAARWVDSSGLFVLPYDAVRKAPDPARSLLDFLESTYETCAALMGWNPDLLVRERPGVQPPPPATHSSRP